MLNKNKSIQIVEKANNNNKLRNAIQHIYKTTYTFFFGKKERKEEEKIKEKQRLRNTQILNALAYEFHTRKTKQKWTTENCQ